MNAIVIPGIIRPQVTNYLLEIAEDRGDALAIIDIQNAYTPDTEGTGSAEERTLAIPHLRCQHPLRLVASTMLASSPLPMGKHPGHQQQSKAVGTSFGCCSCRFLPLTDNRLLGSHLPDLPEADLRRRCWCVPLMCLADSRLMIVTHCTKTILIRSPSSQQRAL